MPRFGDRGDRGDRHGMGTRLLVKNLSSRTMARHLDDLFSRYGRVRDVDVKQKFGFVEFYNPRDANAARDSLSGRDVKGCRITVRFVKGAKRCKVGDWKNKFCRGHIQRNCPNSPKKLSDSCSPSPCRGLPSPHKGRIRSRSFSRSRSYRSKRSRSPRQGRSPKHEKGSHVASCDEKSPDKDERQASGGSFRSWSRCPIKEGETKSPTIRDARSRRPYEENGRHRKWMRPK